MRIAPSMACLIAATILASVAGAAEQTPRTNVILIMADDIGYECFGCYGSRQYSTPNIDAMAAQGMRFTHCYSQPLCTPSRVKLMTGLSNVRNYSAFSVLNKSQKTIGDYFVDAGFRTAVAGKWQLYGADHYKPRFRGQGTLPGDAGFENFCLWQVDRLGERYQAPLMQIDGKNRQFDKSHYGPEVACDYLIDFMKRSKDEPFLVYYPMILVHNPFVPTPDSQSPKNKNKQQNFEDMVAYMDKLVGRIVTTTQELGIAERTLILFVGDNGTNKKITSQLNGREIQGGKGLMTDAGTRVALVALQPGTVPAGRVCEDLVDFSDMLPTTLQAAGAPVPDGLDGHSFWPQLQGQTGTPREWIYCYYCSRPERTKPSRFVRDQRWKLYGDGRFYDVANDVLEKSPLQQVEAGSAAAVAKQKLAAALQSMPSEGQSLLQFDR